MSDDYSDIDPITINSEKELTLEFDNFSKILVDTAKDWNQRLSAIKRLEGIIIGGGFEFEGFPALLTKLYLHINAQVNDLRSAISKEACRLVCIAAEYGQEYTENLCDKLLSKQCLIKVINSATKIISENGHECIMCLLRNSKTPKVIPKIIEEASSKSVAVRQKISQYLYIVVELFEEPILEKYMNILEEAINSLIGDANKEVRQVTRQTFGMYADKFPPRAAKMFPAFDPSVQKTLVDEGLVDPSAYMKKALSINTKEGKSTQRPSSVSAKKNVQSAGKMGETFNFANSDKLVKSPEFEKKSATLPRSGSNEDNKTAPKRSRPSERQGIEKKSPESGGLGGTSYAPGLKGHMTLAHAKSLPEDTSKLMKSMTSKGIASQRIPAKEIASKQHESINISRNESRNESDREVAYRSQEGEDLSILLENTDNEDWATRANAFEQINEYVANLQPHEQPSYSTMNDLVEAHIKHLNDYHYKVVVSCQESFSRLITIYHSKVLPYLDRIIPPLFVNLTEGKDKVISSTNFLINLINKIYSGDEMIPHFLKSLDSYSKIKYKTSVVEFMNILIRNCQNYFNSQAAIKTCVSKFAAIIGEFTSTKSIVMPCLGMILYLRDINLTATITAIGSLDMNLMSKVRALAVEYAPDLEENLQVYLLQAKGNGKPEVRSSMSVTNSTSISSSKSNSLSNTGTTFTKKQDGIAENQISYQEEVIPTKKTFSEKVNENNDKGLGSTLKGNKSSRIGPGVTSPSVRSPVENSIPKTKVPQQNIQIDRIPETVNNKSNGSTPVYTDVDDFLQAESNALSEIGKEVPKETQQILSELVKIDSLISDFPKKKDEIQKRLENITATLSIPTLSNDQKAFDYSLSILANLLKLPLDFSKHIEALISGIVSLYANTPKGNHTIDEILRTALQLGPADTALRALLINLEEADSPIAQILIKNITKLGLQCPQSSLLKIMPPLVARYKELINHSNPDVRKNVVFSIVDFYLVNPQELQKHINDFSANHQKLIGIYIQKKSEGHSTEPDKR